MSGERVTDAVADVNDEESRGGQATSAEVPSGPKALRIFLNYRREDSSGHAGRLYDDLAERYEESEVFIDIDKIEPGLDFVEAIERALSGCDVVLALIGKHWLTITDAGGQRRIDNPDDYVRLELEAALAHGTRVIPVCVQGSEMPSSIDLPESLKGLARRHATELSDKRWRHDVETLATVLDRLADDRAKREWQERVAAEEERTQLERAERERLEREAAERERDRQALEERERVAQQAAERERLREHAEQRERLAQEAERERLDREAAEVLRREEEARKREQKRLEREATKRRRRQRSAATTTAPPAMAGPATREAGAAVERAPQPQRWKAARRSRVVTGVVVAVAVGAVLAAVLVSRDEDDGTSNTSAPAALTQPTISGETLAGSRLKATRGVWDGAPTEFAYRWQRCDGTGGGCSAISSAAGRTYAVSRRDVGRRLRVVVSARNGAGLASSASSRTRIVRAPLVPPKSTRPPVVSGSARVGAALTAARGTWRGTTPVRTTRAWLRCLTTGACVEIAGATGATYVVRSADVGFRFRVLERASNRAGRALARSAPTAVVSEVSEPDPSPSTSTPPSPPSVCPPTCPKFP